MKITLIFLVIIGVATAIVTDDEWAEYKEKYGKIYDAAEDAMHRCTYAKTKAEVEEHNEKFNLGTISYTLGINEYTDMTREEIRKSASGLAPQYKKRSFKN